MFKSKYHYYKASWSYLISIFFTSTIVNWIFLTEYALYTSSDVRSIFAVVISFLHCITACILFISIYFESPMYDDQEDIHVTRTDQHVIQRQIKQLTVDLNTFALNINRWIFYCLLFDSIQWLLQEHRTFGTFTCLLINGFIRMKLVRDIDQIRQLSYRRWIMEYGLTPKDFVVQFNEIISEVANVVGILFVISCLLIFGEQFQSNVFNSTNENLSILDQENQYWGWLEFQRLGWIIWWWIYVADKWNNVLEQYTCLPQPEQFKDNILSLFSLYKHHFVKESSNRDKTLETDLYQLTKELNQVNIDHHKIQNYLAEYEDDDQNDSHQDFNLDFNMNTSNTDEDLNLIGDFTFHDESEIIQPISSRRNKRNKGIQSIKQKKTKPPQNLSKKSKKQQQYQRIMKQIYEYKKEWNDKLQALPSFVSEKKIILPYPQSTTLWMYKLLSIFLCAGIALSMDVIAYHESYDINFEINIFVWDGFLLLLGLYCTIRLLKTYYKIRASYSILLVNGNWAIFIIGLYWLPRRLVENSYSYISWITISILFVCVVCLWALIFLSWINYITDQLKNIQGPIPDKSSKNIYQFYVWLINWQWQHYIEHLNKLLTLE